MTGNKARYLPVLVTTALLLAACGNGGPSNGDIRKAIEDTLRFELRQRMGSQVADVELRDVASRDCIAKGEQWICRVDAILSMKRMYNGKMEPHEEKFSDDIKLEKADSGWTIVE